MKLEGIHHVTAITEDGQRNADFYAGVLGLRMVKKTVNQDDPSVYHLFYADELGSAGADLTFFEYPGARPPPRHVRILEERDVAPRASGLVRVEQVVDGRVVLVHRLLDEPKAEDARVEVDVPRRVGGDAGDVVDAFELHANTSRRWLECSNAAGSARLPCSARVPVH